MCSPACKASIPIVVCKKCGVAITMASISPERIISEQFANVLSPGRPSKGFNPGAKASLTAVSVQREILFSSRYPVWNFPMLPRPTMPRRTFFIEGEVRSVVAGKKRRQLFSAKFSTGRTRRSVPDRSPLSPTTLHFCNVPERPGRKPRAILPPRSAQSFHPSKPIQP